MRKPLVLDSYQYGDEKTWLATSRALQGRQNPVPKLLHCRRDVTWGITSQKKSQVFPGSWIANSHSHHIH